MLTAELIIFFALLGFGSCAITERGALPWVGVFALLLAFAMIAQ